MKFYSFPKVTASKRKPTFVDLKSTLGCSSWCQLIFTLKDTGYQSYIQLRNSNLKCLLHAATNLCVFLYEGLKIYPLQCFTYTCVTFPPHTFRSIQCVARNSTTTTTKCVIEPFEPSRFVMMTFPLWIIANPPPLSNPNFYTSPWAAAKGVWRGMMRLMFCQFHGYFDIDCLGGRCWVPLSGKCLGSLQVERV